MAIFFVYIPAAYTFTEKELRTVDGVMGSMHATNHLAIANETVIFDYKNTIGKFHRNKNSSDNRYFHFSPGQGLSWFMLGYRFPTESTREAIMEKKEKPLSLSSYDRRNGGMRFRTLEFSRDAKSVTVFQECWETGAVEDGKPALQCVAVNKAICDQIVKPGFNWNESFRKFVEPERQRMIARLEREFLPENINENRTMGFKPFAVLPKYQSLTGDVFADITPPAKSVIETLCTSLTWTEDPGWPEDKNH